MLEADFVIIGSGSAGSAMAYRLSEEGKHSVIVIEFGGTDMGPLIQMPSALSIPLNMSLYDWGFASEPEPHLGGRVLATPRGKVIGGSSSINGMVYVRGHAHDFDHWAEQGAAGWGFADVLPYFKRMEDSDGGEDGWRGHGGPLHVQRGTRKNPLYSAFMEAGRQAGFELTDDYNGSKQEGFGPMEQTILGGRRWSAANAYLKPALRRKNVNLLKGFARRVVIENQRAVGVEIEANKKIQVVKARREVIVAASSINSPKILMLSGIGPGAHLQENGIPVVADRPGVGANLQDHLELYIQQEATKPITLNSVLNPFSKAMIGAQWLFFKTGLGATNHFEAAAFVRSAAGVDYPDIQYHFIPAAVRYDGKAAAKSHGFQAHVGPMRSKSRGSVTLRSPDARAKPVIRFNYMSHPDDWSEFRHCIRLTREIFGQKAFDGFRGKEISPGSHVQTDDELDAFIRDHAESAYHPCGTCRMGRADDLTAVVDPECRVIGVEGLRVADSSIFPRVTNGNLNAPSIMTGEKASDHILGRTPLAPSNQEPWINPRWQVADR
ncbi:choline dehydrogenase [Mesorhizobium sp. M2D.F.Ca.ET.185.01.1.1]|uniref:choline dehydrogenase n=1 Tax=unclassified Mesorhizobium TaxID=325217 RepID=UPI000FCAD084|nr:MULTISPECIES: choline dehydrogenase [unclassified Mesorhizobium]TGP56950.1 choline dehydrogenase [bacterium M00.F.Ca.ET.230.01.1.1]TGP92336.1 choline dehydrogenase [bacterium M00.F.Ca.ET.222.01.1.1]TGP96890.1 choline dehydrogenase [bacterium M00.F.Ca.ET.221.01.1.1]TGU06649.1 choline dehydrogenase [bacterium M00.F.Ca.ET.163.01.1.1]TGU50102.1 choline dehydrogenase [bacterium M00.F.Ca.ET.146.01.1.1]TGV68060.1 choline dehydrogenase [Mesorhizobium sp. M2D.F.Ca.ET.160.01.1.1]TGW13483.1 choline 